MKIEKLEEKHITEDFLETLNSLRSTYLTVEEAKEIWTTKEMPLIYVAVDNDKVIGTATLLLEQKFIRHGAICGHIEDVAVHVDCKRKGVGKLLVDKLIEVAKEHKCYKVILDCDSHLASFYEKSGFKVSEIQMRLDLL